MITNPSPYWTNSSVRAAKIAVALTFAVLIAAICPAAAAQSSQDSQGDKTAARPSLVVTSSTSSQQTVALWDKLEVLVTLQNQGILPIAIPTGALRLRHISWHGENGGWDPGEGPLVPAAPGTNDQPEIVVQPGDSVLLVRRDIDRATDVLGPLEAHFTIRTKDQALREALGGQPELAVTYYVGPSKLVAAAWVAKTPADWARLQPELRNVLMFSAGRDDNRDREHVKAVIKPMGCYALPLLEGALKDPAGSIRKEALLQLEWVWWNAANLNIDIEGRKEVVAPKEWAAGIGKCSEASSIRESVRIAIAALADTDAQVQVTAIGVLTDRARREPVDRIRLAHAKASREQADRDDHETEVVAVADAALPIIRKLASEGDPSVRSAAQQFLSVFAADKSVAADVAGSLADSDASVRAEALNALKTSQEAPPMTTIEQAFVTARGDVAVGMIDLFREREGPDLAAQIAPGFSERTAPEKLAIMTTIAGHTDEAALGLIKLGLKDSDAQVQRAALNRLLTFPADSALSALKAGASSLLPDNRPTASAVHAELESRALFSLLAHPQGTIAEQVFPSKNGTAPMVSPDGRWVAYVETGGGRPGGIGLGRSNLLSITHVVKSDGSADRVVSDMFLAGWTSDSSRLASSRDGFAAIVDLQAKITAEFGGRLDELETSSRALQNENWAAGDLRSRRGGRMPHSKRFGTESDYGENAAFSPDGKWFGPRPQDGKWQFVDSEGHSFELPAPPRTVTFGSRAVWSPDGSHVIVVPVNPTYSLYDAQAFKVRPAPLIDFLSRATAPSIEMDQVPLFDWEYRKARWNPWSRDGKRLAFIRNRQVLTADYDGSNAQQITFDASNKVFPTFSPDETKIAYVTWQAENRPASGPLGPTDIWVVDCGSGLAVRVTAPDPARIEGLDWLDDGTLIFDRLDKWEGESALKTISLR